MQNLDNYLEELNEDFNFTQKVFKANKLKNMVSKIKSNVKGKNVNVPAIKRILKPIPVLPQEKINKFLSKYVPNYMHNYNMAYKHFKKKYPKEKNLDTLAGVTAVLGSMDQTKTAPENIKRTERMYSMNLGTSGFGGAFVMFVVGLGVLMVVTSLDLSWGTTSLASILGILLMLMSVLSLLR